MKKKWATNERTTNLREPFVETLGISKSKIIIKPFLYELFRRYLDDGKSRMRRSYLLLLHFRSDKKQKTTPDAPTFRVFLPSFPNTKRRKRNHAGTAHSGAFGGTWVGSKVTLENWNCARNTGRIGNVAEFNCKNVISRNGAICNQSSIQSA